MKKLSVMFIVVIMLMTLISGCKENQPVTSNSTVKKTSGTIKIGLQKAGYGSAFMEEIVKAFMLKNPDIKVQLESDPGMGAKASNKLQAGPSGCEYDLFFTTDINFPKLVENAVAKKYNVDSLLLDLSELYNETPSGETIKIKDKLSTDIQRFTKVNGKDYILPWASGPCGLAYNVELFEKNGWQVPSTTDELIALVNKIYNDKVVGKPDSERIYPIIWAGANATPYWTYLTYAWWAQYEGVNRFYQYLDCQTEGKYSISTFQQNGKLEALKVSEKLVAPEKCYPNSIGLLHTQAQMLFLDGKAAMIPTGDWIENEMVGNFPVGSKKIAIMKTPLLSAAIGKWGKDSAELEKTSKLMFTLGAEIYSYIPAFSPNKDLSMIFLKYFCSDEAISIFFKNTGSLPPLKYKVSDEDLKKSSFFRQEQIKLINSSEFVYKSLNSSALRYRGGLPEYPAWKFPEVKMANPNKNAIMSAEAICKEDYSYFQSQWNTFMKTAGLS
jgi:N-acetylglucosamine transport system substrate-binding protein